MRAGLRYFFLGVQVSLPFASFLTVPPPSTLALNWLVFEWLLLTEVAANAPLMVIAKAAAAQAVKLLWSLHPPMDRRQAYHPWFVSRWPSNSIYSRARNGKAAYPAPQRLRAMTLARFPLP